MSGAEAAMGCIEQADSTQDSGRAGVLSRTSVRKHNAKEITMTSNVKKESQAQESEFKGKPVLTLSRREGDKYPLRFGVAKAGLILAHLEDIKAFCARNEKKEEAAAA